MITASTAVVDGGDMKTKLDTVWDRLSKEKAVDFLKRAVGPRTTVRELASILSYDKVAEMKDQLAEVQIGEVIQNHIKHAPVTESPRAERTHARFRTTRMDLEREEIEVLAIVRDNPGINRSAIAKKVRGKLTNKSLSHVSYLLRRLGRLGKVVKSGDRKSTTYHCR